MAEAIYTNIKHLDNPLTSLSGIEKMIAISLMIIKYLILSDFHKTRKVYVELV